MSDATNYRPVYALPLFTWLLLLLATPIGVFFLWYHKHYHLLTRLLITLFFLPLLKVNLIVSLVLVVMIFLQLLGSSNDALEKLWLEREKLNEPLMVHEPYTIDALMALNEEDLTQLIKQLFLSLNYREHRQTMLFKGLMFKKGAKETGVLLINDGPITKEHVVRALHLISDGTCDHMILFSRESMTLYAEEFSENFPPVSLWSLGHLVMMLNHYGITMVEKHENGYS